MSDTAVDIPFAEPVEDIPEAVPVRRAETLPVPRPILDALPVEEPTPAPVSRRGLWGYVKLTWWGARSVTEWSFGVFCLIGGLAILAATPVLQFLTLGYLLEAGGRIARTGRFRDGFIGVRLAARAGSIVLGAWLMLLPLRMMSSLAVSADVIDPGGPAARQWRVGLIVATVVMVLHIVVAISRGGKLRHFFWPFTNPFWLVRRLWRGGYFAEAREAVWNFVMALRLPYYFWLGLRGFVGGFVWLAVPVTLIALGRKVPPLGFLGAFLLMIVVLHLPFLQMRFAAENRFRALFEWRAVRACFRRAPWAFAFSFFILLLFAVPLYLLRIEMIPREAAWLPSLFFIGFIFPARLLTGWAYMRSQKRQAPHHWFFRWTARLWMVPVVGLYVIIVFFTQYTAWEGIWSLYEQHAFLLPVPFMSM